MTFVKFHKDLIVYQKTFSAGNLCDFQEVPLEERYSLTNQIRRSSRSVMQILQKRSEKEDMRNHLSVN